MENSKEPAFINRQKEMAYIKEMLHEKPEHTLFIYGPKSSGKTTMLYKLVDELQPAEKPKDKYDIRYYNLRQILIISYTDFLQTFFKTESSDDSKEVKTIKELNLKAFKISLEEKKQINKQELDPFEVLKKELEKLNESGVKPVIIIDELQALEGIYMNGQRELIKELFNFFVSITKELHLCHVIIGSSDGYFIERIYKDSKLRKAADFLKVDYLNEEDTKYWLKNIDKESKIKEYKLNESQIEEIWEHFGGSCFELSRVLGDLLMGAEGGKVPAEWFDKVKARHMIMARSMYVNYVDEERQK